MNDRPAPRPITTGDLVSASACLHRWHLDCHGDPGQRLPEARPDPGDEAFQRHCLVWLPELREPGSDPRETRKLLAEGHAWIYRAALAGDGLEGRPDLLRRVEGRSALGDFSYVPAKLKRRSGRAETADLRELQFHALLLEPLLGRLPTEGWIYGPDGGAVEVDLRRSWGSFLTLLEDLRRVARGDLLTDGYRSAACRGCGWADSCRKVWTQLSHVCLLPGMDQADLGAFRDRGYASWTAIAESRPERLALRLGLPLARARLLWLHAKSFQGRRPLLIQPAPFLKDLPLHFYMPEFRDGRCQLHGDFRVMNGEIRIRQFLAPSLAQEGAAWSAFLDDLARDERAQVFTWTDRLEAPLGALWKRHGGNPKGRRHLTRGRRSLHRFLREQAILPISEYSLREVAAYFSFKWSRRPGHFPRVPLPWEQEERFPDLDSSRALLEFNRERIAAMKSIYFALQRLQEFGWSSAG